MVGTVTPSTARQSYHVKLSDGTNELGIVLCDGRGMPITSGKAWPMRQAGTPRTSLQVRSGDPTYGDVELPFTPITHKDFGGGRGLFDVAKDSTRYADSWQIDTSTGRIIPARSAKYHNAISGASFFAFTSNTYMGTPLEGTMGDSWVQCDYAVAFRFPAQYTGNMTRIKIPVYSLEWNKYGEAVTVHIYSDSAGSPGASLASQTVHIPAEQGIVDVYFTTPTAVTGGTYYWVYIPATTYGIMAYISTYGGMSGLKTMENNGSWVTKDATRSMLFGANSVAWDRVIFFEYKYALYAVTIRDDGGGSRLYRNGYRGFASSNAANKSLLNSGLTINENLTGGMVRLVAGTGSGIGANGEREITRSIQSNVLAGSAVVCEPPWRVTHDATTEYVITGSTAWTEIANFASTVAGVVSDVVVYNNQVYFAMGANQDMWKGTISTAPETWSFDQEVGNRADFLCVSPDLQGVNKIWKVLKTTCVATWSNPPGAWPADLVFSGTTVTCGNPQFRVTNLIPYGPQQIPYVLKEESIGSIGGNVTGGYVYAEIPLAELRNARSQYNGRAATQYGVYLFISSLDGVGRFYEGRLDDVGPNRDDGMPVGRGGFIADMISYPGRVIACIDAGPSGNSSIIVYNQLGWHEIYRAPIGERITSVYAQVNEGEGPDLIFFHQGGDIKSVEFSLYPLREPLMYNVNFGYLDTGWYATGFAETNKYWDSVVTFSDNIDGTIQVYYQLDRDSNPWVSLGSQTAAHTLKFQIGSYNVSGKRIRFRIVIGSNMLLGKAPKIDIKAFTINVVTRLKPKKSWNLNFLAEDAGVNLSGARNVKNADQVITLCNTWADSDTAALPLTMSTQIKTYHNKRIFCDPPSVQPIEVVDEGGARSVKMLVSMTIFEV